VIDGIEREFAGGKFCFALPVPGILAIEKGPLTPALRSREYPISLFQLYDEISAGIGLDASGAPVRLPGAHVFYGDLHNILEQALKGGNSGDRDGEQFEVGAQLAARLVNEHLPTNIEGCTLLVWDILHATIKGVSLKKSPEPAAKPKRTRRSAAAKS
jgi:hypothetical protein